MISAVNRGHKLPPVASTHPGTVVLFRWAEWQKQHAYPVLVHAVVLRKKDFSLLVYEYGPSVCVVIKLCDTGPRMRNFREWRQPLTVVQGKLVSRGWEFVGPASGEVCHAH